MGDITIEEEFARGTFNTIEKTYKETKKEIEKINEEIKVDAEKAKAIEDEIKKLEEKAKEAKTNKSYLNYKTDIAALKINLEETTNKQKQKNERLNELGGKVAYINDKFKLNVPEGLKILENMAVTNKEARGNIKKAASNIKLVKLQKENSDLNLLIQNLDLEPELNNKLNEMPSTYNRYKDLLVKQRIGIPLTEEESKEFDKLKSNIGENEKYIKNYCKTNDIKSFNFNKLEKNLIENEDSDIKNILGSMIEKNEEALEAEKDERALLDSFYTKAEENEVSEAETEAEAEAESVEIAKPSLWNKIKNKFTNFISKFKKQDKLREEVDEEAQEAQDEINSEEKQEPKYSEEYRKQIEESEFIKDILKVREGKEENNFDNYLQYEKRKRAQERANKRARESSEEIER